MDKIQIITICETKIVVDVAVRSLEDCRDLYKSAETQTMDSTSNKSTSTDSSGVQLTSNSMEPPQEVALKPTENILPEPTIKISPAESGKGKGMGVGGGRNDDGIPLSQSELKNNVNPSCATAPRYQLTSLAHKKCVWVWIKFYASYYFCK